jgi:thymidylate synthase
MIEKFETFDEAYRKTICDISRFGTDVSGVKSERSIGSGFGLSPRPFKEILNYGFCLNNPRARILKSPSRNIDKRFAQANFLFTLAGGQDLEMITHYNSRGSKFFEAESRYETAFGCRLFSPGHQIEYVKEKLSKDRESRRAVAQIYEPVDTLVDRRDTPCAMALHFLIRDEKLHCVCFMRSQSAIMILPYDVYLFTMIHEWIACEIGVALGTYSHQSSSIHYYAEDFGLVEPIMADDTTSDEMFPMTQAGPKIKSDLIRLERQNRIQSAPKEEVCLGQFWNTFLDQLRT